MSVIKSFESFSPVPFSLFRVCVSFSFEKSHKSQLKLPLNPRKSIYLWIYCPDSVLCGCDCDHFPQGLCDHGCDHYPQGLCDHGRDHHLRRVFVHDYGHLRDLWALFHHCHWGLWVWFLGVGSVLWRYLPPVLFPRDGLALH